MRRRYLVVASAAAVLFGAGLLPASATSDIGLVPIDETPVHEYGFGGDQGGHVISAGVEQPRADGVQLVAGCHFVPQGVPNTSDIVLVGSAQASATSVTTAYGAPVSVGVACTIHRVSKGVVGASIMSLTKAAPGTTVATAAAQQLRYGEFTVCTSISARYSNETFLRTETECRRTDWPDL